MAYSKGKKLTDEGIWAEFGDAKWLIGRAGSTEWMKAQDHFERPFKKKIEQGKLSVIDKRDINLKSLARSILLDWKGVEDEGKKVSYSEEEAFQMLMDDPDLLEFVLDTALENDNYRNEKVDKTTKKSAKPSSGG